MKNVNETTFFKSKNIKVTNLKVTIFGKSYNTSDIAQAMMLSFSPVPAKIARGIVGVIGLLMIAFGCTFTINGDLIAFSILGFILVGWVVYTSRTSTPSTYNVRIIYQSKNISIYQSEDKSRVENIVNAINEARKHLE